LGGLRWKDKVILFGHLPCRHLISKAGAAAAVMNMNGLDWFLAVIFAFGILRGLWRGAISQAFGIAGVLGGFLLASHAYEGVAAKILLTFPRLTQPHLVVTLTFVGIFMLTWFCLSFLGYWVGSLFRRTGLGCLDRVLGAGIGMAKAFVMAIIVISSLTFLLPSDSEILRESQLAPYVQYGAQYLVKVTPPRVQQLFEEKRSQLYEYWLQQEKTKRPPVPRKKTS
jgi:membrane protein required for colicin V production